MVGIKYRKKRGMKLHMKPITTSCQYLDRSSVVTPTKVSLIQAPVHSRTGARKLDMPASRAKLVASICFGVIFAKMTDMGKKIKH